MNITKYFELNWWFPLHNKVRPISQNEMKYFDLLQTVNRGDLLTEEDLKLIRILPRENLLTIIKLYNINMHSLHVAYHEDNRM